MYVRDFNPFCLIEVTVLNSASQNLPSFLPVRAQNEGIKHTVRLASCARSKTSYMQNDVCGNLFGR